MDNGWQSSADAWVADMGESGDFGRRYVLDPVMLPRAVAGSPRNALDVGCGEGRFCRMLKSRGAARLTACSHSIILDGRLYHTPTVPPATYLTS
jgi:SAM-dependent methyltransferase